jgi:hypothetical protein
LKAKTALQKPLLCELSQKSYIENEDGNNKKTDIGHVKLENLK